MSSRDESTVAEFHRTAELMDEILEHASAILFWILEKANEGSISLDDALGFHIKRMRSLLAELHNPPPLAIAPSKTRVPAMPVPNVTKVNRTPTTPIQETGRSDSGGTIDNAS
jgi:hypothetical protein